MVVSYLDWITGTFLPALFKQLNSLMIIPGVSLLGFCVAITILCIGIGAILLRA